MSETQPPRARILVVEDEEALCALIVEELSDEGYEVVCAGDDRAVYELLDAEWRKIDAIVVDINLGRGTTGFDVARYARKLKPDIPVVYMTGGSEISVERFGVAGSVLVSKPFDRELLVRTLRENLSERC